MNQHEIAKRAKELRDSEGFKHLVSDVEARLSKVFLNAASSQADVEQARQTVVGLSAVMRELRVQIDAPKKPQK